jgi:hypothetical protein
MRSVRSRVACANEPEWRGLLRVEPVEFEASVSQN